MEGLEMKYFILKPKSKHAGDRYAAASRKAMRVYANLIMEENPGLSVGLTEWANNESEADILLYGKEGE